MLRSKQVLTVKQETGRFFGLFAELQSVHSALGQPEQGFKSPRDFCGGMEMLQDCSGHDPDMQSRKRFSTFSEYRSDSSGVMKRGICFSRVLSSRTMPMRHLFLSSMTNNPLPCLRHRLCSMKALILSGWGHDLLPSVPRRGSIFARAGASFWTAGRSSSEPQVSRGG